MDVNCQQIFKISRMHKDLTEVKIFLKVLGGYFFEHPVDDDRQKTAAVVLMSCRRHGCNTTVGS